MLLGGDLFARQVDQDNIVTHGYGDTSFTLKYHHTLSQTVALGLEGGFKSPTAKSNLGSGKTDYGLNGIVSWDSGVAQVDLNLGVSRLGDYADNEGKQQVTWAACISRPVMEKLNLALELSGTARKGTRSSGLLLTALSYEWNKRTVFDVGAAAGLGKTAQDWNAFAGVTFLWEKLH